MDPIARAAFPDLMTQMGKGNANYGYPDQLGLITIGRGNMIPNLAAWMHLDWRNPDGSPATSNAIQTAWTLLQQQGVHVRAAGPERWPGGGAFRWVTRIRATQESLDELCFAQLDAIDAKLRAGWPGWDVAPPPAQSGLARIAWAHAYWCSRDWIGCSTECDLPSVARTEPGALELERDLFRQAASFTG